jgi:hypothetical protein
MGGGLLQLVAYGAQDAYLTGNPQITFWKGLYKRHTNFAMEPFRINFTGQQAWNSKQSAIIGRHADLLYSTYLEVTLPTLNRDGDQNQLWNDDQDFLGFNLIKYVELDIGGQIIDRLYGEWLTLWSILSNDANKVAMLNDMASARQYQTIQVNAGGSAYDYVGSFPAGYGCTTGFNRPSAPNTLYIPLYFFFTKNPSSALPLIALQYHEVKINVLWNTPEMVTGDYVNTKHKNPPQVTSACLYIDYIYLDVEERRRMAQQSHEYLIEQTQYNEEKGISSASNRIDLTFNHPVKELVWVVQPANYTNCKLPVWDANTGSSWDPLTDYPARPQNDDMNYYRGASYSTYNWNSGTGGHGRLMPFTYDSSPIFQQKLQINGQDRMDVRNGDYFNRVQPYQHHSGNTINYPGIYMYSFALRPEEHQPSGTCNFSRIDTAHLVMDFVGEAIVDESRDAVWNVRVYAVNYNILRIMSGMAGLAYSN